MLLRISSLTNIYLSQALSFLDLSPHLAFWRENLIIWPKCNDLKAMSERITYPCLKVFSIVCEYPSNLEGSIHTKEMNR
jgi:hypothetical protein